MPVRMGGGCQLPDGSWGPCGPSSPFSWEELPNTGVAEVLIIVGLVIGAALIVSGLVILIVRRVRARRAREAARVRLAAREAAWRARHGSEHYFGGGAK